MIDGGGGGGGVYLESYTREARFLTRWDQHAFAQRQEEEREEEEEEEFNGKPYTSTLKYLDKRSDQTNLGLDIVFEMCVCLWHVFMLYLSVCARENEESVDRRVYYGSTQGEAVPANTVYSRCCGLLREKLS